MDHDTFSLMIATLLGIGIVLLGVSRTDASTRAGRAAGARRGRGLVVLGIAVILGPVLWQRLRHPAPAPASVAAPTASPDPAADARRAIAALEAEIAATTARPRPEPAPASPRRAGRGIRGWEEVDPLRHAASADDGPTRPGPRDR